MKALSQSAEKFFRKLFKQCDENEGYLKIDNSSSFMAVVVENIGTNLYSVAHYYEQNGDLVCDPDVTFWVTGSKVFPASFEQGGLVYQRLINFKDGAPNSYDPRRQREVSVFCTQWAKNIQMQQEL